MICAGRLSLIASNLIYSFAMNIMWIYVSGMFLGIGFLWTTPTMVGTVVNRWCRENRGTIMESVLASNSIGAAIATQVLTQIIYDESTALGCRMAYFLTAVILGVVFILVLVFYKKKRYNY